MLGEHTRDSRTVHTAFPAIDTVQRHPTTVAPLIQGEVLRMKFVLVETLDSRSISHRERRRCLR